MMTRLRVLLLLTFVVKVLLINGTIAQAQEPSYTLEAFLTRVVKDSPEIKESYFEVDYAKARLEEASAAHYGFVDFLALTGVQSNARANGEKLYAEDAEGNRTEIPESEYLGTNDGTDTYQGFGGFFKGTLTAVVPLWTWGKLDGYVKAATAGIGVEQAKAEIKKHEVIKRIKEFFYGYQLASDALDLGDEVGGNLDKAINKAKRMIEEETGEVSQTDLERLLVGQAELRRQLAEAKQGLPLAKAALRGFAKIDGDFQVKPNYLELEKIRYSSLDEVVLSAWKNKPELKQLSNGLKARRELVKVEESEYYPTLFVGARFSGGKSDARDVSNNPFLNDDGFGPIVGGPALGLKWNMSFFTTQAKVAQAEAQYRALQAKEEFAKIGIPLQVEQAYRKVLEHKEKSEQAKEGTTASRRWMVSAVSNYDVGIGDAKTLMEGIGAYAMMKISYLKAKYEYNLALATLSQVIGEEATDLQY
jgi:outer membrane protein